MKYTVIIAAIAFSLASCAGGSDKSDSGVKNATQEETQKAAPETTKADPETAKPDSVTLTITGNDQMQYNKNELHAKAGQIVTLKLKNVGTMDVQSMGHNWCLLKQGVEMSSFATDAMKANDNGYIPKGTNKLIAHTDLVGGGQETSVTFTAPKKGEYTYMCSFPGHYATMNGKFIVE